MSISSSVSAVASTVASTSASVSVSASTSAQSKSSSLVGTPTNVSEPAFEFLLSSILHWVEDQCHREQSKTKAKAEAQSKIEERNSASSEKKSDKSEQKSDNDVQEAAQTQTAASQTQSGEPETVMIAEHAAAKMERLGYDVGYRLSERLAQSKSLIPPSTNTGANNNQPPTPAAVQLEAVKFICKEFWMEVYHKQIDKLQTNHRGVFVLKDMEFKWLKRLPGEHDLARIMAIKILAFPCGLIRGALANLGIVAVVSCDFLADGRNMSCCSFNIKIKSS